MKINRFFAILLLFALILCGVAGLSGQTYAADSQADAVIYALDEWAQEFISIPDDYPVSYQIDTQGDENATFYVYDGDSCSVSETGLVTPRIITWYWYDMGSWRYGTTRPREDMEYVEITHECEFEASTICARINGVYYYYTVDLQDYAPVYASNAIDQYVAENFTDDMTTDELLNAICRYPASFNYDAGYSGATGMVISGGGDCWASTDLILEVCERLGVEAKARNGNRDPGSGSGHMNVLVTMGEGEYYELEAGYNEPAPRYYSIQRRTSLFCFKSISGGLEVYQYDGDLTEDTVLEIPSTHNGRDVVAIGESFLVREDVKEVIIPETVTRIGRSAFNSCEYLQTLHIPASVTSIEKHVFTNCNAMRNLTIDANNPAYTVQNGVLYNKSMTTLVAAPGCSRISIPSTVTTISDYAIYYNMNLEYLEVPASVKTLNEGAISGCTNLRLLILRGVETLSDFALAELAPGASVYFTSDAPTMAETTFYRNNLTAYYPKNNATWTAEALSQNTYGEVTWTATEGVLAILEQPCEASAAAGKVVKTTVEAVGDDLRYQWYVAAPGKTTFSKSSNTTATYSCKMSAANDGRRVYCVITDKHGNSVTTDTVTLYALTITTQPADAGAKLGKTVKTTVSASGQELTYQWFVKEPGKTEFAKSSVTSATYGFKMTAEKSGREVYCVITDRFGTTVTTRTAVLEKAVSIVKQPVNTAGHSGKVVKASVEAAGRDLTYQWYVAAPGKTKFTKSSNTSATYSCKMSAANDGRRVYCVVTDAYGNTATSETVTLTMVKAASITGEPADGFAQLGQKVKTTVEATGEGLRYTWYIKEAGGSKFVKSSVTSATYSYKMTAGKSGRQVYCVVTDKFGNTVTTRTVTLRAAASITAQPTDASAGSGKVIKATVEAFGTDLTYQWYVAAPGKTKFTKSSNTTATYACKMSAANDGRRVYCVITDAYGNTVTTQTVTLTLG